VRTTLTVLAGTLLGVSLLAAQATRLADTPTGAAAVTTPTFYKDVLPVLQRNCQSCHRPGEVAPMSLLTYEQARPWARAIKTAIANRQMPPWFADPNYGHFSNERRLSSAEIETINKWVDAGAPAGNTGDAPAPLTFENGWNIKPDIVVEMPKAFPIPASGTINYKYVVVKGVFTEDLWVSAAEMRPGNSKVLHHGKVWVRPPGSKWMARATYGEAYERESHSALMGNNAIEEGNDILGKFNPGLGAQRFDMDGAAKFIDFVLKADNGKWVVENIMYKTPNKAGMEAIDKAMLTQYPNMAMSPADLLKYEQLRDLGDGMKAFSKTVSEIMAAK